MKNRRRFSRTPTRRLSAWLCAVTSALALAGCGGSPSFVPIWQEAPLSCSAADLKPWVASYMGDAYYWRTLVPPVNAAAFDTAQAYFDALLSPGGTVGGVTFPRDRWSFSEPTEDYDLFFDEGKTLGYGVAVAALEIAEQPSQPLRVRYVEPASPAATAGVRRGDTVLEINGTPASQYVANGNDFSVLTPDAVGQVLSLRLRDMLGQERNVSVVAAIYALTPLARSSTVTTTAKRQLGYLLLKDFLGQASTPLASSFAQFRTQGINEVVLDLRYNTGGLVSVARDVASYVAGASNGDFVRLLFNDRWTRANQAWGFLTLPSALNARRVYVLTGPRTCSAAELVINGLEPFVEVVVIGDTTCGKPVGFFKPPRDGCGTTYSAVNFESVNDRNEGRYWNGLLPNAGCAVADDLDHALGDTSERLLAAALKHADTGSCGAASALRESPLNLRARRSELPGGEGERPRGLLAR